ncbi:951_t:CDS:1 [Paraglomus occultum]|uniref:951_t:CDS:1 n=1 Tax=Paraglomus occultum TaxID=144539 RepID=A0A9N9B6L4_9GLOM|nr:951_t:CDS:1 [Paraglomus occultum]
MSAFMPHLILREVFTYISAEDSFMALSTLHSCMLVNHHWCSVAIKVFWFKPFRHRSPLLIHTLLYSLSSSERDAITLVQDISLPPISHKPYYDYPLYLRDLDYWAFTKSIKAYIARMTRLTTRDDDSTTLNGVRNRMRDARKEYEDLCYVMSSEIIKMFIRKGVKLYYLRVLTWEDQLDTDEYLLLLKPESHSLISSIRELELASCYQKSIFLSTLAKICCNIRSMHLTLANWSSPEDDGKSEMLGLAELVKAQKSLRRIQFWTFKHYGANVEYVLDAIQTQAESITEMGFYDVNFTATKSLDGIAACYNLEQLTFKGCDLNDNVASPLVRADFPRLNKVEVCPCHNNGLKEWAAWRNLNISFRNRGNLSAGRTSR